MDFDIEVSITPEIIAEMYQIDLSEFMSLIESKRIIRDEKTILFVVEDYVSTLKLNKKKSKATIEYYITILRRFAKFVFTKQKEFKMYDLTEDLFMEFLSTCRPLKKGKLMPRTINTYSAIIKNLLEFAYTRKYI